MNTMSNMIEQIPIVSKVIGMIAAFIKYFTDFFQTKGKLDRDHDITVFRKLDSVANESRLDDILNSRIANSRLRMEDHYALADLIDALNRIENAFLNNTLKSRASELVKGLDQLLICVMRTFFRIPNGYLKFYPDIIDGKRYDAEWREVTQKIDTAWKSYKAFRLAVKKHLRV